MIVTQTVGVTDTSGIIEVSEEYEKAVLVEIYDYAGNKYTAEKMGIYIRLYTHAPKGQYLYVVMTLSTLKKLDEAVCENAGGGYYRVQGLRSRRAGIDGLYQTAPGDIEKIGLIVDAAGREYRPKEFRADMFYIEPLEVDGEIQEIAEPLTAQAIEYVPPFIFALLSQNLSKADEREVTAAEGDAVLTFPYNCDIGADDVLTVLAGTYTQKEVVNRVDGADDVIGAYFVMDIVSCIGVNREYQKGKDYILAGTNRLKWLCEDAPEHGEAYSLVYHICPTYKVIKSIPQVRTSESQRLPKKAVVKLYSTHGEKRGINRQ
ncbi:MAG: hypothetical protein LBL64_01975 [Treponema sp.]|nr:hypothetical protein [Treponema sp.]